MDFFIKLFKKIGKEAFYLSHECKDGKKIIGRNTLGQKTLKIDQELEDLVLNTLKKEKIGKLMISEEKGEVKLNGNEGIFILDPLDGSNNYLRGVKIYALAISFSKTRNYDDVLHSYIKDLVSGDEFWSIRGEGAFMNNKRIFSSEEKNIEDSILEFDGSGEDYKKAIELLKKVKDIRRLGANVLGLCYIANGSHQIFLNFKPISIVHIAALKICEEAGAIITDFSGKKIFPELNIKNSISFICSANEILHEKILNLIRS